VLGLEKCSYGGANGITQTTPTYLLAIFEKIFLKYYCNILAKIFKICGNA
jgi:hypothetical protein